jgi:hypothetical protein
MTTALQSFENEFQSKLRSVAAESIKEETSKLNWRIKIFTKFAWFFVALGFVAAIAGFWSMLHEPDWHSLKNLGDYGSFVQGPVASLWALSGLIFIYTTFLAQRMQLMQQARELQDQKAQFESQQDSIRRQNFESAFFQLLDLQHKLTMEMRIVIRSTPFWRVGSPVVGVGRECFEFLHPIWKAYYDHCSSTKDSRERILRAYEEFYGAHNSSLAPFFTSLYHVFKFVKESEMQNKRNYTSLVRAQLSAYELAFLFYNCLTPYGKKFSPLVVEFGVLEHLDCRLLLEASHKGLYPENAYK